MRRTAAIAVVGAAVLAVFASGCGGKSDAQIAEARNEQAQLLKANVDQAGHSKKGACEAQLGTLFNAEQDLKARLRVGVTYADYSTRVGNIAAAYAKLEPIGDADCDEVRSALNTAMRHYTRAGNFWSGCIGSTYCSTSYMPGVQTNWSEATVFFTRAKAKLNALGATDWVTALPISGEMARTSVYQAALDALCSSANADLAQSCADLRVVLADGVTPDEEKQFDDAVKAINENVASPS